jgi:hypothetical protein
MDGVDRPSLAISRYIAERPLTSKSSFDRICLGLRRGLEVSGACVCQPH